MTLNITSTKPCRPFLRWAGSKRKQLHTLERYVAFPFNRYFEPFAGSACLFFLIKPNSAVLGDKNGELMQLYRCVRSDPVRLFRRLVAIPRDSKTFYRWRAMVPTSLDVECRALRFLYLNRNCFNGIYRTNEKGQFNVPFGRDVGNYPSREEFIACSNALKNVELVSGDFEDTLASVRKGDFVYLDPPFAVSSRRIFHEYGRKPFSAEDVPRLAHELRRIADAEARFIVSYADCREARALASQWHSTKLKVRRHVAGFVGHRANAYEWLISNYPLKPIPAA